MLRLYVRSSRSIFNSRFKLLVMASAALPLLSTSASAQDETELPPIVVEGATLEAPPAKAKKKTKATGAAAQASEPSTTSSTATGEGTATSNVAGVPINELGTAVTVITGAQLRAQQIRLAADALRSLPGVSVSRTGSPGGKTQVRIRGAEANHTLVLIDGIEANDVNDGDFDWSNLMADDIEQIEVIRGAQSGIYGSKAVGGVINIITKGGRGPITASARVEGGSFGTRDVAARLSGGTDKLWLALGAQYRKSDGFNIAPQGNEDDPWDNATVSVKGGLTVMQGMTLDFVARNTNKFTNFDEDPTSFPVPSLVATDAPNTQDTHLFLGGVNLRWDLLDGAFTQVLSANRNVTDTASINAFGLSDNKGELEKLGYLATYRLATPGLLEAKHTFSGFVGSEDESFTPNSDNVERKRGRIAYVGAYRGEFFDRVFADASVRRDDNDNFVDYTTWHSGLSVSLSEIRLRPHASVGTGVALPGLFEQFGFIASQFSGNPNLQPEETFSWDAGAEVEIVRGKTFLDLTYFHANLTNEIAFNSTFDSLINLPGESEREGVEVALRTRLTDQIFVGASYTYLDATDPSGNEEIRRPPHSGRADLTWLFDDGRGTFNVAAIYNGDTKDTNFGSFQTVTLDEYVLVNAGIAYRVEPNVEVFGRVENALNEDYEEISGFNTPGIAAYAGVRVTLEDAATASWAQYK